jgi:predicted DCC family thiol-disulfide oxidoreductase YuxK
LSSEDRDHSIVLFDGTCNLCNRSVRFIIQRDPEGHFRFAPRQSAIGQKILQEHSIAPQGLNSILLVEADRIYDRSTAALRIARRLNRMWPLLYGLILIPRPLRDLVYRWIAANRYRMSGQTERCMLSTPAIHARFLPPDETAANEAGSPIRAADNALSSTDAGVGK